MLTVKRIYAIDEEQFLSLPAFRASYLAPVPRQVRRRVCRTGYWRTLRPRGEIASVHAVAAVGWLVDGLFWAATHFF